MELSSQILKSQLSGLSIKKHVKNEMVEIGKEIEQCKDRFPETQAAEWPKVDSLAIFSIYY